VRLALLTGLLALALATPARAQEYQPVVGSGSFNTAPILAPGRYRDTVLPEEYLYYAVKLQAGQHMHVVASSEIDREEFASLNLAFIAARVQTPDRLQSFDSEGDQLFTSSDDSPADFTTPTATTVAGESQGGSNGWDGPGYYFLSFYAAYVGARAEPPKAEIPFHFEVTVEGTPETEPAATPDRHADAEAEAEADRDARGRDGRRRHESRRRGRARRGRADRRRRRRARAQAASARYWRGLTPRTRLNAVLSANGLP